MAFDELVRALIAHPAYTLPTNETQRPVFDNQLKPGFFRSGGFRGIHPNPNHFGVYMHDLLDRRPGLARGWDARDQNWRNRPNPLVAGLARRHNI